MDHYLTKMLIVDKVTELISKELSVNLSKARDLFYSSSTYETLEDEESGLYGEDPYRTFQLFLKEYKK